MTAYDLGEYMGPTGQLSAGMTKVVLLGAAADHLSLGPSSPSAAGLWAWNTGPAWPLTGNCVSRDAQTLLGFLSPGLGPGPQGAPLAMVVTQEAVSHSNSRWCWVGDLGPSCLLQHCPLLFCKEHDRSESWWYAPVIPGAREVWVG